MSKFLIHAVMHIYTADGHIIGNGHFSLAVSNLPDDDQEIARIISQEIDRGIENWRTWRTGELVNEPSRFYILASTSIVKL